MRPLVEQGIFFSLTVPLPSYVQRLLNAPEPTREEIEEKRAELRRIAAQMQDPEHIAKMERINAMIRRAVYLDTKARLSYPFECKVITENAEDTRHNEPAPRALPEDHPFGRWARWAR